MFHGKWAPSALVLQEVSSQWCPLFPLMYNEESCLVWVLINVLLTVGYCPVIVWASGSARTKGASWGPGLLCLQPSRWVAPCLWSRGRWSKIMRTCIEQRQNCSAQAGTPRDDVFSAPSLHLSTQKLFLTDGCSACSWKIFSVPSGDMPGELKYIIQNWRNDASMPTSCNPGSILMPPLCRRN